MIDNYNETPLFGKKILLIALPGYPNGIIRQMEELGAQVDYMNDKPNDGFVCKTLGRFQLKTYLKVIDKYYIGKIDELKQNKYDYILVIRGEYTTTNALKYLKKSFPKARLILYMWDGLHKLNTKGIENKWSYYDKVFTFDRIDYEANKDRIHFRPLYYYEEYLPENKDSEYGKKYKYDISFIGTGHADRVRIVKQVMEQCENNHMKAFKYIYMPHPFVYLFNRLFNKNFRGVKRSEIRFKMLPFDLLYKIYGNSKCIVDVENPGQHGLTMRTIETIGLKKKFITTNEDIKNYDFYNSNNILVIDRNNPRLNMNFFKIPFEELPHEIYEKYSLRSWILEVLE